MMRWHFMVLGLIVFGSPVLAAAPSIHVSEPRAFGYFIGDVLTRTVWISVDADARIDPATVPKPGPLNYWLKLQSVSIEETQRGGKRQYKMLLRYQTFYAPLEPRKLQAPSIKLRIVDAHGESGQAVVPPFSFLSSPLREIMPEKESDDRGALLRPDVSPKPISTMAEWTGMTVSALVAMATLALLAHHFAIWPFHRRRARPFTRAMRAIAREAAKARGEGDYRGAFIVLHRAFDEAARRRVLAADLDRFLAERREFYPLKPDIERFFAQSARAFFADDMTGTRGELPLPALAAFATALSERERAA